MKRHAISAFVAANLILVPIQSAADNAFVGGLVGGIIGGALAGAQKPKPQTRTVYKQAAKPRSTVNTAQREENRTVQTALNYFGFNAGTPDGVFGNNTRRAVTEYQAHMGYSPTGQLTSWEKDFLTASYYRAQSGGPSTAQIIASNPMGVRGLLIAYRDEQTNGGNGSSAIGGHYGLPSIVAAAVNEIAKSSDPTAEQLVQRSGFIQLSDINGDGKTDYVIDTSVTGSAFWCNAQSCAVRVFASTPEGYERNDFQAFNVTPAMFTCQRGHCVKSDSGPQLAGAGPMIAPQQPALPQTQLAAVATPVPSAQPVVQGAAQAAPAIPQFFGSAPVQASLESHCNKVNLLTSTNGGFVTADTMLDAGFALNEQLCLTRTYAIASGEDLMTRVPNLSPTQIAQQCAAFGQGLREKVAGLSVQDRASAITSASSFILASGMSPAQLEMTATICMASGYKSDDMDTALGSALLLVALGKTPYAELIGHHLSQGFGATKRADLASEWYGLSLNALDSGAEAVFAPGQPERVELLRKASLAMTAPQGTVAEVGAIPVFAVSD